MAPDECNFSVKILAGTQVVGICILPCHDNSDLFRCRTVFETILNCFLEDWYRQEEQKKFQKATKYLARCLSTVIIIQMLKSNVEVKKEMSPGLSMDS